MSISPPAPFHSLVWALVASAGCALLLAAPASATYAQSASVEVAYEAGWNLIAAPQGIVVAGADGPLYTLGAGDSAYRPVPPGTPLQAGVGYWAYFPSSTRLTLFAADTQPLTVRLPPAQFLPIGNPGLSEATVSGADLVYTYAPSGGYQVSPVLQPGEGAWAYSATGGTITIGGAPASHGGGVQDLVGLVDALRAAGATVRLDGPVSQPFFAVTGQRIIVGDQDLQVFEFPAATAAEAAAAGISADGGTVRSASGSIAQVDWVAPPHFFRAGRAVVLYVGTDGTLLNLLEQVLGPQFAGR